MHWRCGFCTTTAHESDLPMKHVAFAAGSARRYSLDASVLGIHIIPSKQSVKIEHELCLEGGTYLNGYIAHALAEL